MKKLYLFGPTPPPVHGVSLLIESYMQHCHQNNLPVSIIQTNVARDKFADAKSKLKTIQLFLSIMFSTLKIGLFDRKSIVCIYTATYGVALMRDLITVALFKLLGKKIYLYIHGTELTFRPLLLKRIVKYLYSNNFIIHLTEPLSNEHKWLESKKTYIVPNGINEFCSYRPARFEGSLRILFFSNVFKEKGIEEFIETLTILNEKKIDFEAKIFGVLTDKYSVDYINILSGGLVDQCKLTVEGGAIGIEKSKAFEWADILLFPSHKESFGNVIIEAMSAGTLVISSNTTSAEFILGNGAGYVVESFAVDAANLIENLDFYTATQQTVIARGRFLECFTAKKYFSNLDDIFWSDR